MPNVIEKKKMIIVNSGVTTFKSKVLYHIIAISGKGGRKNQPIIPILQMNMPFTLLQEFLDKQLVVIVTLLHNP